MNKMAIVLKRTIHLSSYCLLIKKFYFNVFFSKSNKLFLRLIKILQKSTKSSEEKKKETTKQEQTRFG